MKIGNILQVLKNNRLSRMTLVTLIVAIIISIIYFTRPGSERFANFIPQSKTKITWSENEEDKTELNNRYISHIFGIKTPMS